VAAKIAECTIEHNNKITYLFHYLFNTGCTHGTVSKDMSVGR